MCKYSQFSFCLFQIWVRFRKAKSLGIASYAMQSGDILKYRNSISSCLTSFSARFNANGITFFNFNLLAQRLINIQLHFEQLNHYLLHNIMCILNKKF